MSDAPVVATEPGARATVHRALRRAEVLAPLGDEDVRSLVDHSRLLRLGRGDPVWRPGEPPRELAIVARGRVQSRFHRAGPRDWVSSVVAAQGACGLAEVLDPCVRRWSVEALEPSQVVLVEAAAVGDLLQRNHAFALHVARTLARDLRASCEAAEGVALCSPLQRVAHYLLEMSSGSPDGELDATQGRIAARLGTVREVVGRSLRRLEQAGLIERRGRSFRILRADGLTRVAEGDVNAVGGAEVVCPAAGPSAKGREAPFGAAPLARIERAT